MTALARMLRAQIAASGPISVADYMTSCLLHPEHGYYTTREALGRKGDFTTAPEISQMFGELLGLCLAQAWMDQGAPRRIVLAELGPGRGTLMADFMRATRRVPGFHDAAALHLVEASPRMRAAQQAALSDHAPQWHGSVAELPEDAPLFLVANEFFDALPIRQFLRDGDGWRERVIGLSEGSLAFGLTERAPVAALDDRLADTRDGDLVELCAPAGQVAAEIGARIARNGGAALVLDYGDWRSLGDTLQAVRDHGPTDPLAEPGLADLTAHVDFAAIASGAGCAFSRLTPQGVFLERLGITPRARSLAEGLREAALESHVAAHRRLTHPDEMGTVFKCLGLYPEGRNPPPGLEP